MSRLLRIAADVRAVERRAVALAFACNFMLLGSYYILRPITDTVATIEGVGRLQLLFTGTFVGTLLASPLYTALASRVRLSRLLPGVFWFWLANVLVFAQLLRLAPDNLWIDGAYYIWFSVSNLFMISVFWSLMVDLFSAAQATRLFALIAAGGEIGAIAGPVLTRVLVGRIGLPGLLLTAAAGFLLVAVLTHVLIAEQRRLRLRGEAEQGSTLEHGLAGGALDGFRELARSSYALSQGGFVLLMSWVGTVAYFFQTGLIAHAFSQVAARTQVIADIDLAVNACTAFILLFGVGHLLRRFGVTAGLVANPVLMLLAFVAIVLVPSVSMIQAVQVVRRVAQYALARPSRQICFTVMPQSSRYKTKSIIDTVFYRFGDLSSAWMQSGLRAAGFALAGSAAVGFGASILWGALSAWLGRRYEQLRRDAALAEQDSAPDSR